MAYLKPQSPLKNGEDHVYPLTTYDQIIMADGSRWNGESDVVIGVTSVNGNDGDVTITPANIGAATSSEVSAVQSEVDGLSSNLSTVQTAVNACAKKPVSYSATLTTAGWSSSAPYTQAVTVTGILATDMPIIDLNMSSATTSTASGLQEAWACVGRVATSANTITAYCYEEKPTVAIPLNIMVTR